MGNKLSWRGIALLVAVAAILVACLVVGVLSTTGVLSPIGPTTAPTTARATAIPTAGTVTPSTTGRSSSASPAPANRDDEQAIAVAKQWLGEYLTYGAGDDKPDAALRRAMPLMMSGYVDQVAQANAQARPVEWEALVAAGKRHVTVPGDATIVARHPHLGLGVEVTYRAADVTPGVTPGVDVPARTARIALVKDHDGKWKVNSFADKN